MEFEDKILAGSIVVVRFATHPPIEGEVLDTPTATGDCWKIRSSSGAIVYVQQFDFMQRQDHA